MRDDMSEKKKKKAAEISLASTVVFCILLPGCGNSGKNYRVDFVERNSVSSLDRKANPLILVVEVREDGKLSLNKIASGTISDLGVLSKNIRDIFDDRKNQSISEREVFIDPLGKIENTELEKVIETLADAKASPIRVIKNNQ
jgi:biopolymer transport protein ExbD